MSIVYVYKNTIYNASKPMSLVSILACLVDELKILGVLSRSIMSIERRLVIKIITRMDKKLRDKFIKTK
jgi:hypothetical protein